MHQSTRPVEQLFLDINEKAQLLEVEDIFKGHCFEIYDEALYDDLRNKWISVKKCSSGFKTFGFENTSQYIYLYLLLNIDSSIPESLTINGKHYLDGKTMDDVEKLLAEMQAYGDSIIDFYSSLNDSQYRFRNICENSWEYRNTNDHNMLKTMCMTTLAPKGKAQYQKLPLMYFVYSLYKNHDLVMNMTHKQFRKIITNPYVYTNIFVTNGAKKSRNNIDHTLRDALRNALRNDTIEEVITAAQELRKNLIQSFDISSTQCVYDKLAFIYTIVDNYNAAENWIPIIYNRENRYNLEHFLIPDNRTGKIKWIGDNGFEFNLPIEKKKRYKKKTINYMIIDENLNEEMEHNDIIYKIEHVKRWYSARNQHIPKHISIIIAQIESMDEYIYLKGLKGINASLEEVKTAYIDFLDSYFDEEKTELITSLKNAFLQVFRNE